MPALHHKNYCGFFPFDLIKDEDLPALPARNVSLPLATLMKAWWTSKSVNYSVNLNQAISFRNRFGTGFDETATITGSGTIPLMAFPPSYRSTPAYQFPVPGPNYETDFYYLPYTWPLLPAAALRNNGFPNYGLLPTLDIAGTTASFPSGTPSPFDYPGGAGFDASWFYPLGGVSRMSRDASGNYKTAFCVFAQGLFEVFASPWYGGTGAGTCSVTVDGQGVSFPIYYTPFVQIPGEIYTNTASGSIAFNFNSFYA